MSVADRIAIEGSLLPDRRCCAMPFQVWYETLAPAEERRVVCNRTFRCDESELGVRFSRADENDGFTGRFAFPAASASSSPST